MSDLIRREDAINAMAELQGIAQSKAELTGISKAWKRIKALPTASPWHRVEDDPPDENKEAIFYYELTGISGTVYKNISIIYLCDLISLGYRPISWMEKPEPPKEGA